MCAFLSVPTDGRNNEREKKSSGDIYNEERVVAVLQNCSKTWPYAMTLFGQLIASHNAGDLS